MSRVNAAVSGSSKQRDAECAPCTTLTSRSVLGMPWFPHATVETHWLVEPRETFPMRLLFWRTELRGKDQPEPHRMCEVDPCEVVNTAYIDVAETSKWTKAALLYAFHLRSFSQERPQKAPQVRGEFHRLRLTPPCGVRNLNQHKLLEASTLYEKGWKASRHALLRGTEVALTCPCRYCSRTATKPIYPPNRGIKRSMACQSSKKGFRRVTHQGIGCFGSYV